MRSRAPGASRRESVRIAQGGVKRDPGTPRPLFFEKQSPRRSRAPERAAAFRLLNSRAVRMAFRPALSPHQRASEVSPTASAWGSTVQYLYWCSEWLVGKWDVGSQYTLIRSAIRNQIPPPTLRCRSKTPCQLSAAHAPPQPPESTPQVSTPVLQRITRILLRFP